MAVWQQFLQSPFQMDIIGHTSFMVVDLGKHKVPGQYQGLRGVPSSLGNSDSRRSSLNAGHSSRRIDETMQIESSIVDAGMVRVAQQVIHAIGIHLADDQ